MSTRHQLEKKLPHEIDIKGIAVALAFLVSVGVFAAGRDDRRLSEDRQSPSVSMPIAPILTAEKTETETTEKTETATLQQPYDDQDFSDTSLDHASVHNSVTP